MKPEPLLRTDRLILRRWRQKDRHPFASLNADADVMEYFPAPLTREQSDALATPIEAHFEALGFGLWAVEVCSRVSFIGCVGLNRVPFAAHFTPAVEVGWRLARQHWGNGYASEAARAAVNFAFTELGLSEVVSFTAEVNKRSRTVMERLGMERDPADDFDHPSLDLDDRLRRHVLYRLARPN